MTGPVRVILVAEAGSDADVVVAILRAVASAHAQWIREHLDAYGWEGLVSFGGEEGERCVTHARVKTLAERHRVRLTGHGDAPQVKVARKALLVARRIEPDAHVVFHVDAEGIPARVCEHLRYLCAQPGVCLALPDPCTEAWGLLAAGRPVPGRCAEAKDRVGREGLDLETLLAAADGSTLRAAGHGLGDFVEQVDRLLVPAIAEAG